MSLVFESKYFLVRSAPCLLFTTMKTLIKRTMFMEDLFGIKNDVVTAAQLHHFPIESMSAKWKEV